MTIERVGPSSSWATRLSGADVMPDDVRRGVPTRVLGYRVIDEVALDVLPTLRQRRMLLVREYHRLAESLDDRVLAPGWLAFARARNRSGSE